MILYTTIVPIKLIYEALGRFFSFREEFKLFIHRQKTAFLEMKNIMISIQINVIPCRCISKLKYASIRRKKINFGTQPVRFFALKRTQTVHRGTIMI